MMPTLRTTPFHVVCGVLGIFFYCFGFVSYLVKERLYLSEACMLYILFVTYNVACDLVKYANMLTRFASI